MIRITLACVGRLKEDYLKRAEAEFVKRLGAYCQLETKVIMEEKMPDRVSSQEERQILQKETDRLLRIIPEHSFVILLDLRGKELSSPSVFAEIGSSYGPRCQPPDFCHWRSFWVYR